MGERGKIPTVSMNLPEFCPSQWLGRHGLLGWAFGRLDLRLGGYVVFIFALGVGFRDGGFVFRAFGFGCRRFRLFSARIVLGLV